MFLFVSILFWFNRNNIKKEQELFYFLLNNFYKVLKTFTEKMLDLKWVLRKLRIFVERHGQPKFIIIFVLQALKRNLTQENSIRDESGPGILIECIAHRNFSKIKYEFICIGIYWNCAHLAGLNLNDPWE